MPKVKEGQSLYVVEALETGLLKKAYMVWASDKCEAVDMCREGKADWITREIMDSNDSNADEWLEASSVKEVPDAQV